MLSVIYTIIWVILVADCLLLILLILAQESKSTGLGGLGGGMDMSFGGSTQRKVKRLTAACAIIFGVAIIAVILIKPEAGTTGATLPAGATPEVTEPVIPENMPQPSAVPITGTPAGAPAKTPAVAPAGTPAGEPAKTPPPTPPAGL